MLAAEAAILAELKFFRLGFFILGCGVVSLLALSACEGNYISHCYSFSDRQALLPPNDNSACKDVLFLTR